MLVIIVFISIIAIGAIMVGTSFTKKRTGVVRNDVTITIGDATITAEIANTEAERSSGLGGRDELSTHEGMLFIFDAPTLPSFWMKDMKFPIDIVWIRAQKIIGFAENVDPQIGAKDIDLKLYTPPNFVDTVLELGPNAGRN